MESDLNRVKKIILGDEYDELLKLRDEINDDGKFAKLVSNIIAEALKARAAKDDSISEALSATIDQAISSSINQDPKKLAQSLYPIMGPAIRKSISETMQQMLDNLNQLLEDSVSSQSLRWRFDAWRTGRPYSEIMMLNTLEYSVEQVFLIHRETSLLIHHQFSEFADTRDPDMVSSMFSAIQDFIEDSFSTQEGDLLDTLRLGELSILLTRGPYAVLAVVVRGRIPEGLRNSLSTTLESLHRLKKSELANYGGDPDDFADIADDLKKLLLVQRKEAKEKGKPWLAMVAITAMLSLSGYWYYIEDQAAQFRASLVSLLSQEPGLVVLSSEFDDDVLSITLLADPLAKDPSEIVDPIQEGFTVSFSMYSHLSALDEIVGRRVTSVLIPSPQLQTDVRDGRLFLSGRVDGDWLAEFNGYWPAITGVNAIDISALNVFYPRREAIAEAIETLQSIQIDFEKGDTAAELDDALITDLAAQIMQLNAVAIEETGRPINIDIVGYTDETGSEQLNQRVGLERARSVRTALVGAGATSTLLTPYSAFNHPSYDGLAERIVRLVVTVESLD